MIALYPLYRLQQVDTRILQLQNKLSASDGSAELEKKVRVRESKRQTLEKQLHANRISLKDAELQLATVEARVREIQKKLYSGNTRNPKELASFNKELALLGTQKGELEERVLQLMDEVEATITDLTALEGRLSRARKELDAQRQQTQSVRDQFEEQLGELVEKRNQMVAELVESDNSLLIRYEALRKRKDGVAVARLEANNCGECGTGLPDSIRRRVQERQLVYCSSCERILFTD